MTNGAEIASLVMLAGEQAAPNLLPARYFNPSRVFILHTEFPKSRNTAENLGLCLREMNPTLVPVADFDVGQIREQVNSLIGGMVDVLINITGGTKPMSIGALEAAFQNSARPFYVRSQGAKTEVDLYAIAQDGMAFVSETIPLTGSITIDDYLVVYFGREYQFTGFGTGPGEAFERAIHDALLPHVDEIMAGWKHSSGAVDVDFVIRCNNQIGLIEAKTGQKALKSDGIKQLAVAGGQRFFGTYVKRFLVVDQLWVDKDNIRSLADAIGIIPIELPGFADGGTLTHPEREKLAASIHKAMGMPLKSQDG